MKLFPQIAVCAVAASLLACGAQASHASEEKCRNSDTRLQYKQCIQNDSSYKIFLTQRPNADYSRIPAMHVSEGAVDDFKIDWKPFKDDTIDLHYEVRQYYVDDSDHKMKHKTIGGVTVRTNGNIFSEGDRSCKADENSVIACGDITTSNHFPFVNFRVKNAS